MADLREVMALAQQGLRSGWTQAKVRQALTALLERERRYLERRKAQGNHTPYDDVTEADQVALALAICWLVPDTTCDTDSQQGD